MRDGAVDLAETRFVLPPDARLLAVDDLAERLRTRIGPVADGCAVVTRPGNRIAAQLLAGPLADLVAQFNRPHRLTDAVLHFSRGRGEDPMAILDVAFDALATLVESRVLVAEDSPDASGATPGFGAGQVVAGWEVERLVRSLDDSEVYRARGEDGARVALKVARGDNPIMAAALANEAAMLDVLGGHDSPRLVADGSGAPRPYLAIEWRPGMSIGVAAQRARAAQDRPRLHALVADVLEAYARLHEAGVLHGDVHPGNCLVDEAGRVALLDFGNARLIDHAAGPVDLARSGVVQFHDPQFAQALLAGRPQPSATPASEQYAIGVLATMLLTGLHPIDAPAVTEELLERITSRRPRPFPARGVPAWLGVEQVLAKALERLPEDRHPDLRTMATAFRRAGEEANRAPRPSDGLPGEWPPSVRRVHDAQVAAVRDTGRRGTERRPAAWFALRTAMGTGDAELLAAADVHARLMGDSWDDHLVRAHVAWARGDAMGSANAIKGLVDVAEGDGADRTVGRQLEAVAGLLSAAPAVDQAPLVRWAEGRVAQVVGSGRAPGPSLRSGVLAMAASGAIMIPADLSDWFDTWADTVRGDPWLWAWAHDVFADEGSLASAVAAPRSSSRLGRAMEALRLHQLTGDLAFVTQARDLVEGAWRAGAPPADIALVVTEANHPERAVRPPFEWR